MLNIHDMLGVFDIFVYENKDKYILVRNIKLRRYYLYSMEKFEELPLDVSNAILLYEIK